jgi:hypothetical protein
MAGAIRCLVERWKGLRTYVEKNVDLVCRECVEVLTKGVFCFCLISASFTYRVLS